MVNCGAMVEDGETGGAVVTGTGRAFTLRRKTACWVMLPLRPRRMNTPELVLANGGTLISNLTLLALRLDTRPVNRSVRFGRSNTIAPLKLDVGTTSKVYVAVSPAVTVCASWTKRMSKFAGMAEVLFTVRLVAAGAVPTDSPPATNAAIAPTAAARFNVCFVMWEIFLLDAATR